jgi:hypothetical protein
VNRELRARLIITAFVGVLLIGLVALVWGTVHIASSVSHQPGGSGNPAYDQAVHIAYDTCDGYHGGVKDANTSAVLCVDGTLISLPG